MPPRLPSSSTEVSSLVFLGVLSIFLPTRWTSTAKGLRQALAATELFYSSDLNQLNTPSLIDALDARPDLSTPGESAIPSLLVRLSKADFLDQSLEKILTASGLVGSKSEFSQVF